MSKIRVREKIIVAKKSKYRKLHLFFLFHILEQAVENIIKVIYLAFVTHSSLEKMF